MTDYRPRVVDRVLRSRLSASGAVVLEGPKACGKTETARQVAASEVLLDIDPDARQAAAIDPGLILDGPSPRLIDEWQLEPALWNHVRRRVDASHETGRFILTGSSVPDDDVARHTGAGRLTRLRMRPMSLAESGHSSGGVSLAATMAGDAVRAPDPGMGVSDVIDRIVIGGWPAIAPRDADAAAIVMRGYLDEISRVDLPRLAGPRTDSERVSRVVRSLARHSATYTAASEIARDAAGADGPLDPDVVRGYIRELRRLMIVEDLEPWSTHLRSRSVLRSAAKRHLVDPSLAVAALRATRERLLKDLRLTGFLFETLVIRDLRVYADAFDGHVRQYRDNTGLEVDAIVDGPDGRWAAFEVKLGTNEIDAAAESLKRFVDRVDTDRVGPPAMVGVIVGTGYAYTRDDGIAVIPIWTLGP